MAGDSTPLNDIVDLLHGSSSSDYDFLNILSNQISIDESPYADTEVECNYYDETQFISKFKSNKLHSMLSLNIQSLPAKYTEFSAFISDLNSNDFSFDFIALQELWTLHDSTIYTLPDYHNIVHKSRPARQGGGVGFFIKKCWNFHVIDELSLSIDGIFESIVILVNLNSKKKILLASIYRPTVTPP